MSSVTIRGARREDLAAIVALLANDPLGSQRETAGSPVAGSYVEAFAAIEADADQALVVGCRGDAVVGVLQLTFLPHLTYRGGWRAQIEGVRIAEVERSRGLGRQMIEWAIERARARGCHMVQLTTDKTRPDAKRFYEALGFAASHEGMKLRLGQDARPWRSSDASHDRDERSPIENRSAREEPMSEPAPPHPSAARDAALEQLRNEHRMLARVIEALETLTAEMAEATTALDFPLLAAMLYYVDAVPERLHHPKEDSYLFAALRARDPASAPLLDRLEREHRRSPCLIAELERALVHWQGGAHDGLEQFTLALGSFCEFHWAHMRAEESEVLPAAERALTEADWSTIAGAFCANEDPLFGARRRQEFERLYHRIVNLSPRKLKLSLLRREHAGASEPDAPDQR